LQPRFALERPVELFGPGRVAIEHTLSATAQFGKLAGTVGLPGTLHVLRYAAATLMLSGSPKNEPPVPPVPLHIVAARLGDRAERLLGVYSHLLPTSDAEAAAQVAALIPVSTR
jgi:integrase